MAQVQQQTVKAPAKAKTQKSAAKAETAEVKTVFIPANPPTSGRYLFAFTHAAMLAVLALPKAKQSTAARIIHGTAALRHHGKDGTRKMVANEDGTMSYDAGYFQCGPKSMDEKRRGVPESYVRAFSHYFDKGEFPPAMDGFAFKASGKKTLNIGLK